MPAYYRSTGLNRVAPKFVDHTILSGQEIEDVVAYLVSLQPKSIQTPNQ
jgi:sulfur-oxidizing protein SoxX